MENNVITKISLRMHSVINEPTAMVIISVQTRHVALVTLPPTALRGRAREPSPKL